MLVSLTFTVILSSVVGEYTVNLGTCTVTAVTHDVASRSSFAVISACFNNLAAPMTFQRERESIKRWRGMSLP